MRRNVSDGMLRVLTGLPREIWGLTEIQSALIAFLGEGLSDKAIARRMDDKAVSTIRNHRFRLRRRVTEAKLLAALGELLDRTPASRNLPMPTPDDRATRTETRQGGNPQMQFVTYHHDIPAADERGLRPSRRRAPSSSVSLLRTAA